MKKLMWLLINGLLIICFITGLLCSCASSSKYGYDHVHRPIEPKKEIANDHILKPLPTLLSKDNFYWSYGGENFIVELPNDPQLDADYEQMKEDFDLISFIQNEGADYLQRLPRDSSVIKVVRQLKKQADDHHYNDNQFAELIVSFVQSLDYDWDEFKALNKGDKKMSKKALKIYKMPYQVLYRRKAVCFDDSVLGIALFREAGFGAAMVNMPDNEHAAFAIQCDPEIGFRSGYNYRFIEATSRRNIGVMPFIMNGREVKNMTIALAAKGKVYRGIQRNQYIQ